MLLRVKLERTMGWNGFGPEERTLGRAKAKHSGFSPIPSFISCYKLHRLNSLVGVRCHPCVSHFRDNKRLFVLSLCLCLLIIGKVCVWEVRECLCICVYAPISHYRQNKLQAGMACVCACARGPWHAAQ